MMIQVIHDVRQGRHTGTEPRNRGKLQENCTAHDCRRYQPGANGRIRPWRALIRPAYNAFESWVFETRTFRPDLSRTVWFSEGIQKIIKRNGGNRRGIIRHGIRNNELIVMNDRAAGVDHIRNIPFPLFGIGHE